MDIKKKRLITATSLILLSLMTTYSALAFDNSAVIVYHTMDNANISGTDIIDESGNQFSSTQSGLTTGASGIINEAVTFYGADNLIMNSSIATYYDEIGMCYWFKTASDLQQRMFQASAGSANAQMQILANTNDLRLYWKDDDGVALDMKAANNPDITDDNWHLICFNVNGTAGTTKFYIDGVRRVTTNTTAGNPDNFGTAITTVWSFHASYRIDGDIDEMVIKNGEITDGGCGDLETCGGEIAELWQSGAGCNPFAEDCTITEEPAALNITLLTPTDDANFTNNTFNEFSVMVCCEDNDCDNTTVALDPIITKTYTPSSDTICKNGICTTRMFSGTVYTQDNGEWKTLPQISSTKWTNNSIKFSYKNYFVRIEPFIVYSNGHNYTIQEIKHFFPNVSLKGMVYKNEFENKYEFRYKDVPQNLVDNVEAIGLSVVETNGLTWDDIERDGDSIIIKNKVRFSFSDLKRSGYELERLSKKTILIKNISQNYENGVISIDPLITLQDNESDNLHDSKNLQVSPDSNYGTLDSLCIYNVAAGQSQRSYLTFNTTQVPSNATIISSRVSIQWARGAQVVNVSCYNTSRNWDEASITWNNQPAPETFSDSKLSNDGGRVYWTVTDLVNGSHTNSFHNISFVVKGAEDGNEGTYACAASKEEDSASHRPILEITYQSAEVLKNGLVSTIPGTSPVWTNESNPITFNLSQDECVNYTWWVKPNTTIGQVYEFFAIANITATPAVYVVTPTINITINGTGSEPGADSCTYTSGNWIIDCTDNCDINVEVNLNNNNLTFNGEGTINIISPIRFINVMAKADECNVTKLDNASVG